MFIFFTKWRKNHQCCGSSHRNPLGSDLYDDITIHHTIKCTGDNVKVYRVTGKTRRHYPNPEIAESWDANFRDHVITIDCTNFPNGSPMLFKEGAPITCFGNVVKVYRLENNQRRWYPTIKIANSWDSNWRTDKLHMDSKSQSSHIMINIYQYQCVKIISSHVKHPLSFDFHDKTCAFNLNT